MARVKISEYNAKKSLLIDYSGLAVNLKTTTGEIEKYFGNTNLVVKVDEGIKKRGKQGLVKVNVTSRDIPQIVGEWSKLGWSNFLVEPVIEHAQSVERYLALERVREGWQISYSEKGGVEVESSWDQVKATSYPKESPPKEFKQFILNLLPLMDKYHVAFLEMNPVIIRGESVIPLDMACEVDSAGSQIESLAPSALSESEKMVLELDASTPASLKFKLLDPDGLIWVFLSGGGASLVIADEVADQGMGKELANYGEYSGAPTDEDVYSYTKIILKQILLSKNKKPKAIIVAGGVANFTDVAKTFRGLIKALDEKKSELSKLGVKVFVRRGGPSEVKGLSMMKDFLKRSNLLGSIHGHNDPLTIVVKEVKEYIS